jgi:ribosome-associated translation inhibitor RaiA
MIEIHSRQTKESEALREPETKKIRKASKLFNDTVLKVNMQTESRSL